MNIGHSNKTQQ